MPAAQAHVAATSGRFRRLSDGALSGSEVVAPTGSRDRFLQPFASTSNWNLPISASATFVDAPAIRTEPRPNDSYWVNEHDHSHTLNRATDSDPLATVVDIGHSNYTLTYRVPANAVISGGTDRHMHVMSPDGQWIYEAFYTEKQSNTSYTTYRLVRVPAAGSGIGPQNGTRAYGGSAVGGLIRKWEIDPAHPAYTGRIDHVIAMALRNDQLVTGPAMTGNPSNFHTYYTDDNVQAFTGWGSVPRRGFLARGAYIYPATEEDSNGATAYTGSIPMGAMFALPPSVNINNIGLNTSQGLMLARAFQDYGGLVTDRSYNCAVYVEYDRPYAFPPVAPSTQFFEALGANNWNDMRQIYTRLQRVSNNVAATPGGASPVATDRRRPLAAELAA